MNETPKANASQIPVQLLVMDVDSTFINEEVIDLIAPDTPTPFTDLIDRVREKGGRVGVYPVSEHSWMDMGQLEELDNMRRRLEQG